MEKAEISLLTEEVRLKYRNKILAISEVILTYISIIGLMWITELIPSFEFWQQSFLGRSILSSIIYMAMPAVIVVCWHGRARFGRGDRLVFGNDKMKESLRMGVKALTVMLPATFAFPVAEMFGLGFTDWGGAGIIVSFYLIAILGLLWLFKEKRVVKEKGFSSSDARISGGIFTVGLFLVWLFHMLYLPVANIIIALVFVGFMEEFFFRGYMQPRLNLAFEKRFNFLNFQFGWGLVLTSALFGLIHVISPGDNPMQWAWGFWTFIVGISFGVIREKGGNFLAPALVHGITMIFPIVF